MSDWGSFAYAGNLWSLGEDTQAIPITASPDMRQYRIISFCDVCEEHKVSLSGKHDLLLTTQRITQTNGFPVFTQWENIVEYVQHAASVSSSILNFFLQSAFFFKIVT